LFKRKLVHFSAFFLTFLTFQNMTEKPLNAATATALASQLAALDLLQESNQDLQNDLFLFEPQNEPVISLSARVS
jgi:hypothetical protein